MKPHILEVTDGGLVRVKNLLSVNAPKTQLTSVVAAGTADLAVKNFSQFAASWAVQLGEMGEEQTEVLVLGTDALATTAGTATANTAFEHATNAPVYGIRWDEVIFQKATAGTAGTAAAITGGTITYQPNSEYTQFDDTAWAATHAYRAVFHSSVGTATFPDSIQSDWMTSAGLSFYTLGKIRERIQGELWDPSFIKDEDTIDNWINEFKDKMANAVVEVNKDYSLGTADVAFGAGGLGTITTADFKDVRKVEVTYNGSDFYLSAKMSINDFYPGQSFSSTHPYHAWQGDTIFLIKPGESGGSARLTFYRFGTTMVNDTDTLPQPMRPYTDGFVSYGLAKALLKEGKSERSANYANKITEANMAVQQFISDVSDRDKTGVTYMDLTDPTTGEDHNLP